MTKITITNEFGIYEVSTTVEDLTVAEISELFKAAMCLIGYHHDLVGEVFK